MRESDDSCKWCIRRGYSLLFAFVFILYIGFAALPPVLMLNGHSGTASVLYKGFRFLCHQYPWRSYFLGGEQLYYPLDQDPGNNIKSIEESAEISFDHIASRNFYGTPEMGYKMAVCQRDCAIFLSMGLFCLIFFLAHNRIPKLNTALWLIVGVVPMGVDGGTQLLSGLLPSLIPYRESTPLIRTITGFLFGFCLCWFLFPQLEDSLRRGDD